MARKGSKASIRSFPFQFPAPLPPPPSVPFPVLDPSMTESGRVYDVDPIAEDKGDDGTNVEEGDSWSKSVEGI